MTMAADIGVAKPHRPTPVDPYIHAIISPYPVMF